MMKLNEKLKILIADDDKIALDFYNRGLPKEFYDKKFAYIVLY